jgi:predicted dehydrogenase
MIRDRTIDHGNVDHLGSDSKGTTIAALEGMPAEIAAAPPPEEPRRIFETRQSMIRIGVLGTARVVPYGLLAPAKEMQGVEVIGIASRTPQKAGEFAARHGIRREFGSYEALLESSDIDVVYIALPPALHYDWARRAIEAGKHVLCEKPLAENAQLAQELMLYARQHGRVLVEAMHLRHLDKLRRQRELVAGGEFGRLLRIESCFRTPYTPMAKDDFRLRFELGGGAALDVGCYAVSCLRYMAGEEPEILSVRHKCSSPQIDRWMRATLRFPSGVEGVAEFGVRGFYLPRGDVVVTCEKGRIKWDHKGLVLAKNGNNTRELLPTKSTYQLQLEAFAKSIRGEKSNALPPDDAVLTARVLDAMYEKAGLALRGTLQTL